MSTVIKDGTGSGYLAKVCEANRLQVESLSSPLSLNMSMEGKAYYIGTGRLNITATGGRALHFTYSESTLPFAIDHMVFDWNGGNTNRNRSVEIDFYLNDTAPDTNTSTLVIANMNYGSSQTLSATAIRWDGTGDGMTGHTPGTLTASFLVGPGHTELNTRGMLILSPNDILSINLKGDEVGVASIMLVGYIVSTHSNGGSL